MFKLEKNKTPELNHGSDSPPPPHTHKKKTTHTLTWKVHLLFLRFNNYSCVLYAKHWAFLENINKNSNNNSNNSKSNNNNNNNNNNIFLKPRINLKFH